MTPPQPRPAREPKAADADFAEQAIFAWYVAAQEEHDMLSSEGLQALHDAITSTWFDWQARERRAEQLPVSATTCTHVRCKECGYTPHDQAIHMDHWLCKGEIPPPCESCGPVKRRPRAGGKRRRKA